MKVIKSGYVRLTADNINIINGLRKNHGIWVCTDGIQGPRYYELRKCLAVNNDTYWEIVRVRYKPRCPEIPFKDFLGLTVVPKEAQLILLDSLISELNQCQEDAQ